MRIIFVLLALAFLCSEFSAQVFDIRENFKSGAKKTGATKFEGGKFWYWMKDQKDIPNEMKAFYKEFPIWKSEIKGNDKEDEKKMMAILDNSVKYFRLAEKMFEYAGENPDRLEYLWNNPKSLTFLITHPKAEEYLSAHIKVAKKFENREEFIKFLSTHPELKEKIAKYVGDKKEKEVEKVKFEAPDFKKK